jgi:hypothetical protein
MKVKIPYSSWEQAHASLSGYITPHSFMNAYNIVGYHDIDTGYVLEFESNVDASWFLLRFS